MQSQKTFTEHLRARIHKVPCPLVTLHPNNGMKVSSNTGTILVLFRRIVWSAWEKALSVWGCLYMASQTSEVGVDVWLGVCPEKCILKYGNTSDQKNCKLFGTAGGKGCLREKAGVETAEVSRARSWRALFAKEFGLDLVGDRKSLKNGPLSATSSSHFVDCVPLLCLSCFLPIGPTLFFLLI